MMIPLLLFGLGSVIASGVVFEHRRWLTYIATVGVLTEAAWLACELMARGVFGGEYKTMIFLIAGIVWLGGWLVSIRRWHFIYRKPGSGKRDMAVLVVLGVTLLSAGAIARQNGFKDLSWVAHGYYNGDSTTLIALVQRSLKTEGFVNDNPFSGNGPLEYPTLIHAGIADLIVALDESNGWLSFLSLLVYVQIVITVPMFFLVGDVLSREGEGEADGTIKQLWMSGFIIYIMGISWESYIYPQGHFFIMGLFLLMAALLFGGRGKICGGLLAAAIVLVLIFSNAVTGTAALATFGLVQAGKVLREKPRLVDWLGLIIALGLGVIFLLFLPGNGSLGWRPGFSYSAAGGYLYVAWAVGLVLWGVLEQRRIGPIEISVVGLMALSLVTFIFSQRNIVVENSPRFAYHAILLGWPLMYGPAMRIGRRWRDLWRELNTRWDRLIGASLTFGLVFLLLLPLFISVARVHDQLLRGDRHEINLAQRLALDWLGQSSRVSDIVLASPDEPWSVPLLTGRALLRTNYWLSEEDDVQSNVELAFQGDKAAQQEVVQLANYLFLRAAERQAWEPVEGIKKYDAMGIVIYEIGPGTGSN